MNRNRFTYENVSIIPNPPLPEEVIDAYKNKNLVIFVGAGVSRLMGCMGWDQMAYSLINNICKPSMADQINNSGLDSKAKITIAKRLAYKEGKERIFWDIFHEAIEPDDKKTQDIYKTIAKLDGPFITTNCDGLLVKHFPYSYTTKCSVDSFIDNENRDFVFCIHGNYGTGTERDKDSLVFTVDEYMSNYATDSDLVKFLNYVMGKKHVLFIGYGLNEFEIISKAFHSDEDITIKHYILEGFFKYQQELANAQAEYYKSQGVKLIAFSKDDKGYNQQREILEHWVEQLYKETPYASRRVINVSDAVKKISPENKSIVLNSISRDDYLGETSLKAVLGAIPASEDCFKWLDYLIDQGFASEKRIPKPITTEKGTIGIEYDFFASLISCFDKYGSSENCSDKCTAFIKNCISFVISCDEYIQNYSLLTQLVDISIRLNLTYYSDFFKLWDIWVHRSSDFGFYLLKQDMNYISKWSDIDQGRYLRLLFTAPDERKNSVSHFWYEKAAKEISENVKVKAKSEIIRYCFEQINSIDDRLSFTNSLGDRFQFDSIEYDRAVFRAMGTILGSVSNDWKQKSCTYMINCARTPFGWQTALYYAKTNHYTSIKSFSSNPLKNHSTFVEFYCWLAEVKESLKNHELEKIYKWIREADFGYRLSDDPEFQARITEIVSTRKYQLCELLASVDEQYASSKIEYAQFANTEMKTPIEDEKSHFAVKYEYGTDIVHFQTDITKETSSSELYRIVQETADNSPWNKDGLIYRDIYEKLLDSLSKNQISEYAQYIFTKPTEDIIRFIQVVTIDKNLKKISKTNLKKMINRIKKMAADGEIDDEHRMQLCKYLIRIIEQLKSCGWKPRDIYLIASKIDINKCMPSISEFNESVDIQTNILNKEECVLYHAIIESAASCKEKYGIINDFKKWYNRQLDSSRKKLLLITCAYYYGYIAYIDEKWAIDSVLAEFRTTEFQEVLAYCMCCGMTYITETTARFVTEGDRIKHTIELITSKPGLYKYDSRYITYIVAAFYFGYIGIEEYAGFLLLIPKMYVENVFGAIITGIKDGDFGKQKRLLKMTCKILNVVDEEIVASSLIKKMLLESD